MGSELTLIETTPRIGGSMGIYRNLGLTSYGQAFTIEPVLTCQSYTIIMQFRWTDPGNPFSRQNAVHRTLPPKYGGSGEESYDAQAIQLPQAVGLIL